MDLQDYKGVFICVEQVEGRIAKVSYELLGRGKELAEELGTEVTAVLLGHQVKELAEDLASHGADRVVIADDPALAVYMTEPYVTAMTAIVKKNNPDIVLFGATAIGRDLAPRVSARIGTGLTADCTKLEIQEKTNNLMMTRPAFGGNIMATILCPKHRPQMATVRPGVMEKLAPFDNPDCRMEEVAVENLDASKNVEILEVVRKVSEKTDIADVDVLVSGGRGMGAKENFAMLEALADALGGTVSASRAAVDAGWQEKDRQVGQTGKTVRPSLYIACGISGAIQHLAGMEESDIIVAVNKDETAPIFGAADFGIVGDACQIVPKLTQAILAGKEAE